MSRWPIYYDVLISIYWLSDMQVILNDSKVRSFPQPVWSVSREWQPLFVSRPGTAVLDISAFASLYKRQPTYYYIQEEVTGDVLISMYVRVDQIMLRDCYHISYTRELK
jgi:hypothetical protein